ncbi:MAG: threonylcarbamoyl-AMP synthase [Candidatus Eisenbacteria bacterium]|nr:threonylcarbamoyl-AMP synthase [Candidatus Eisenbacteria bacterium]
MREIDLTERSDEKMKVRLEPAARAVRDGDLIIVPTTTFYGLAADATNDLAVRRVFKAKRRDPSKPLLILVDSLSMMRPFVSEVPGAVKELEWRLGSKGLTYVLPSSGRLPDELTAGTGTVGVRVERNEVVRELLALLELPITAPSANVEGESPPETVDDAVRPLRDWIEVSIRWYRASATAPSTIVDLSRDEPGILREGTVPARDVLDVLEAA